MSKEKEKNGAPLVSVCCTTYNLEKFISETLDSILAQRTDFEFEVIVHDDASTDGTRKIVESYSNKYPGMFKTIFQEVNLYTTHSGRLNNIFENHILPNAEGKYIAICDGDDYWTDKDKLQKQITFLKRERDCSACTTNALVVDQINDANKPFHADLKGKYLPAPKVVLSAGSSFPTSTLVFDKSRFTSSKVFGYYGELSKHYDYDTMFIYCLLFVGNIGYLNDQTAIYRRWEGGIFSGIMHNAKKVSDLKEGEIEGNKKLLNVTDTSMKKLFERKISVDALYVLRNKQGLKKYTYLKDLNVKEVIKLLIHK